MKRRDFIISGGAAILLLQARVSLFGRTPGRIRSNILFIDLDPLSQLNKAGQDSSKSQGMPGISRLLEIGNSVPKSRSIHPEAPGLSKILKDSEYRAFHVGKLDIPGKDVREHFTVLHEGGWCAELGNQDVTCGARSFLRNYAESNPFFLSVTYLYPEESCLSNKESCLRHVERMDQEIDLLIQEVERSHWSENTTILYAFEK